MDVSRNRDGLCVSGKRNRCKCAAKVIEQIQLFSFEEIKNYGLVVNYDIAAWYSSNLSSKYEILLKSWSQPTIE